MTSPFDDATHQAWLEERETQGMWARDERDDVDEQLEWADRAPVPPFAGWDT